MEESKLGIKMYEDTDELQADSFEAAVGKAVNDLRIEFNKLVRVVETQQDEIKKLKMQLSKQ